MDPTAQQMLVQLRQNPLDPHLLEQLRQHCERVRDPSTWAEALAASGQIPWEEIEPHLTASISAFSAGDCHVEVARTHLTHGYDRRWWTPAVTMDDLLGYLADSGVDVDLR